MNKIKRHPRPQLKGLEGPKLASTKSRKPPSKGKRLRGPVFRVLPLMILVALFVLGFRVTVVVQDVQTMMASVNVVQQTAFAQEESGARVETTANDPADAADAILEEVDGQGGMMAESDAPDDGGDILATTNGVDGAFNADPQSFTPSELELLQRLAERRKVIEAQAQELQAREAMLQAAETRIDGKIAELQQLEQTLTELVAEADAQQQEKTQQLVRIYGAMKPKDAARIFNDLDMPILLTVVENMKENKVAPILSQMEAMKATSVTEALSARKRLPGIEGDPQG